MTNHPKTLQVWQTESFHRHHPGYQTISANSWWCDDCLKQCHAIPSLDPAPPGHWRDFFVWLSQLLVKGYGAAISATFGLIVFIIDDRNYRAHGSSVWQVTEDDVALWKTQEKWLLVRRHRLLLGIAQQTTRRGQTAFNHGKEWSDIEQNSIENLQDDLDETLEKLAGVQKKIELYERLRPRDPHDYFVPGQENQHGGH